MGKVISVRLPDEEKRILKRLMRKGFSQTEAILKSLHNVEDPKNLLLSPQAEEALKKYGEQRGFDPETDKRTILEDLIINSDIERLSTRQGEQVTQLEKPLEEKPSEISPITPKTGQEGVIKDLLANRCHTKYVDCVSKPFEDEDGIWKIDCPKEIWKKTRYGSTPTGKFYGVISIEKCRSLQKITERWLKTKVKKETKTETKEEEDLEAPQLLIPKKKPELSIQEIVDQLGLCENPILMRQRTLLCPLCKKRRPQKFQACQENQKELKTSPIADLKFIELMTSKISEEKQLRDNPFWWWQAPKTEDMTLEEIEKELGLRSNPLLYEDLKFDAYRKRYHEICETCEEHLHHRCTRYCREFLNGLVLPHERAS